MEQKYIDMIKELSQIQFSGINDVQHIINLFDDDTFKQIQYIKNNCKNLSDKEWKSFYFENKSNEDVMLFTIQQPECPITIAECIVSDALNNVKKPFSSYDLSSTAEIISSAISFNLPSSLFKEIIDLNPELFLSLFCSARYSKSENATTTFSKYIVNFPNTFEKGAYYYSEIGELEKTFNTISDKNFLYSLIENALQYNGFPSIKTALSNNKLLDANNLEDQLVLDRLFNDGIHLEYVKNFTPTMLNYYKNNFTDIDNYSEQKISEINLYIKALLSSKNCPPSVEYDLAMKIVNHPDIKNRQKLIQLKDMILHSTSHEGLMDIIKKLPLKDRRDTLCFNKNITPDVYTYVMHDICNKMRKNLDKNRIEKNSEVWYEDIETYCSYASLQDEDYEFLIENFNDRGKLIKSLAMSLETPVKYLDLIIDKNKTESSLPNTPSTNKRINFSIAVLNKRVKENVISEEQFKALKKIANSYDIVNLMSKEEFNNFLKTKAYLHANFFEDFIKNSSEEDVDKLYHTIDKLFDKVDVDSDLINFNNLAILMKKILKDDFDKSKGIEPELRYETNLNNRLRLLSRIITNLTTYSEPNFRIVELYETLPKIYDDFMLIMKEKERREKDKGMETEIEK